MKKLILLLLILTFTACGGNAQTQSTGNKQNRIDTHWLGNYSLSIDYGKLDEFSEILRSYDLTISKDSCKFMGVGYKTYFKDKCEATEKNGKLYLKYVKNIDGNDLTNPSHVDTLAILSRKNDKYYIKSSIIANKDWKYDTLIKIKKSKNK